jgi:hypothetical protein
MLFYDESMSVEIIQTDTESRVQRLSLSLILSQLNLAWLGLAL